MFSKTPISKLIKGISSGLDSDCIQCSRPASGRNECKVNTVLISVLVSHNALHDNEDPQDNLTAKSKTFTTCITGKHLHDFL